MVNVKHDLFWLKSDLPWSKTKAIGAFIRGAVMTYSKKNVFYVVFPSAGVARKCTLAETQLSGDIVVHEDIILGQDPDIISNFIYETKAPCFIMCNGNAAYEILTHKEFMGSVNIYFAGDRDKFAAIPAEELKLRPGHLPKIIMTANLMWVKDKGTLGDKNGATEEVL